MRRPSEKDSSSHAAYGHGGPADVATMANAEHLAILRQGVDAWNTWRRKEPRVRPDLSDPDLRGADLPRADLSKAKLIEADLIEADLIEADLSGADLSGA